MWKLYEFFKVLQFQKRIVAVATIWGNTGSDLNTIIVVFTAASTKVHSHKLKLKLFEFLVACNSMANMLFLNFNKITLNLLNSTLWHSYNILFNTLNWKARTTKLFAEASKTMLWYAVRNSNGLSFGILIPILFRNSIFNMVLTFL